MKTLRRLIVGVIVLVALVVGFVIAVDVYFFPQSTVGLAQRLDPTRSDEQRYSAFKNALWRISAPGKFFPDIHTSLGSSPYSQFFAKHPNLVKEFSRRAIADERLSCEEKRVLIGLNQCQELDDYIDFARYAIDSGEKLNPECPGNLYNLIRFDKSWGGVLVPRAENPKVVEFLDEVKTRLSDANTTIYIERIHSGEIVSYWTANLTSSVAIASEAGIPYSCGQRNTFVNARIRELE